MVPPAAREGGCLHNVMLLVWIYRHNHHHDGDEINDILIDDSNSNAGMWLWWRSQWYDGGDKLFMKCNPSRFKWIQSSCHRYLHQESQIKISNIFIIMSTCRLVEALGSGVKYYMTVEWRRLVGQDQKTSWFQLLCLSVQKKLAQHCLELLDCIAHIAKYHKYQVCKYASIQVCKYQVYILCMGSNCWHGTLVQNLIFCQLCEQWCRWSRLSSTRLMFKYLNCWCLYFKWIKFRCFNLKWLNVEMLECENVLMLKYAKV